MAFDMFTLSKEADRIYMLNFERKYDLCMSFLRYQEYYESSNPRFHLKKFTLASYIAWYTKKYGSFSYCNDWTGFNLPVKIIDDVSALGIDDLNHYDALMAGIVGLIKDDSQSDECYLIGKSKENDSDGDVYQHEMAHALFYVNDQYAKEIKKLVFDLPKDIYDQFFNNLNIEGYAHTTIVDEIQAYAAEGSICKAWGNENIPKTVAELVDKIKNLHENFSIS